MIVCEATPPPNVRFCSPSFSFYNSFQQQQQQQQQYCCNLRQAPFHITEKIDGILANQLLQSQLGEQQLCELLQQEAPGLEQRKLELVTHPSYLTRSLNKVSTRRGRVV
jgi:hypothetical protein